MRLIIVIISIAALALAGAIAALGPGVRFGLWDYSAAFGWMRSYLALPVLVAAGLAGLAFVVSLWKARGLAPLALVAAIAAAGAGYVPIKMRAMVQANPFIHDITTDFEHPPEILAAADLPRKNPAAYAGAEPVRGSEQTVAEAQMAAFPDIAPKFLEVGMEPAAQAARAAIAAMKMDVLAEGPVSDEAGSGWRIEAVSTSLWYGFKDDFIVRLAPADAGGTRIDVRSKSRVGGSDLGMNAKRVREFLAKLDTTI